MNDFRKILRESNDQMSHDIPPQVLDQLLNNPDVVNDNTLTYDKFLELVRSSVNFFF